MIGGELIFGPVERAPFALDGSLYEIDPLGVIAPRTEADLVLVVKYAADQGLPIHARAPAPASRARASGRDW